MSHVDKGALHAYLDGALDEYPAAEADRIREHLDQCVECGIRLEAERRVQMDAQAILGLAAPEVDMPSLEELRAYVKRTREPRPAATVRIYRMGWAASVVLALGAGWMLRGGQLQQSGLMSADFQRTSAEVMAPAAPDESSPTGGTAVADVAAGNDVASMEEAEGLPGSGGVGASALRANTGGPAREAVAELDARMPAPLDAARGTEGVGARQDLPAAVVADADAVDVMSAEAAPDDVVGEMRDAVASETPEARASEVARFEAAKVQQSGAGATVDQAGSSPVLDAVAAPATAVAPDILAENVVTPPSGRAQDSLGAEAQDRLAADPEAEPERAERRRAESLVPVTSAMTRSTLTGQRESTDEDAVPNVEPALVVEGYDFVSMVNMGEGTTPVGVHVIQRLDDDATFEIFHLEAGVEADVLPPLRDGDRVASVETERGWIIIRGPLDEAELQALLDRLFPDPPEEEARTP